MVGEVLTTIETTNAPIKPRIPRILFRTTATLAEVVAAKNLCHKIFFLSLSLSLSKWAVSRHTQVLKLVSVGDAQLTLVVHPHVDVVVVVLDGQTVGVLAGLQVDGEALVVEHPRLVGAVHQLPDDDVLHEKPFR
jgi:hypothetical protein